MNKILLITPPFTQLNTPYPATPYLKGFLKTKNIHASQMDLGIDTILALFSKKGLEDMFAFAHNNNKIISENSTFIFALKGHYIRLIDDIILFLQGKNQNLARLICTPNFLPQASRFNQLDDEDWAFGEMGFQDKAKHLATLFLEDLSDFIVDCVDTNFGFSRYAEKLGRSANSFDNIYQNLNTKNTFIDKVAIKILASRINKNQPQLICFSVPFPGNLYSAFKLAQYLKKQYPKIKIALGGGFPNTELRSVSDARVFEFFDYITLDDGELPIELLYQNIINNANLDLKRTFLLKDGVVHYSNTSKLKDYKHAEIGTPDYSGLPLDKYISVIEITNPMHSLWSDGRWNKLTMAHGCYWAKCTFCDGTLNYIGHYQPAKAVLLVDRMEELIEQTGERGFHFVDEAAPPALMKSVALEIISRQLVVTWWTNVRFEKAFSEDFCLLLKASGCIAVSGGLEVASKRLLKLINKGVTIEQVARVTANFTDAGIMVHAYLMYGFPTETVQETIDSLEVVRQIFKAGIVRSGFWHQFALTAHSPIGQKPESYNITPNYSPITFANNDVQFTDKTNIKHEKFNFGLKKSLLNFMHGSCFDFPLQDWFDFKIPKTTIKHNLIEQSIAQQDNLPVKPSSKVVWLGEMPEVINITKHSLVKKTNLTFHFPAYSFEVILLAEKADWLLNILANINAQKGHSMRFSEIKASYETFFNYFNDFWSSNQMEKLRDAGLLII